MNSIFRLICVAALAAVPEVHGQSSGTEAPAKTIVIPAGTERSYDEYHYAPAVRVGDTVIVSGIPATGAETYEGKIRNMFERLKGVLAAAGADLSDVVELQTFHAESRDTASFQKEFVVLGKIHAEYFKSGYPAWTAVGTTALLAPNAPVEMRAMAVVGAGKRTKVLRTGPSLPRRDGAVEKKP